MRRKLTRSVHEHRMAASFRSVQNRVVFLVFYPEVETVVNQAVEAVAMATLSCIMASGVAQFCV